MHQILPRLCTSGPLCADWGHDEELARRGVTLVLDLDGAPGDGEEIPEWVARTMKPEEWLRVGIRYCAVPCDDPPSNASLTAACEVIRSELADPHGKVHVHCGRSRGYERAATVITAWLMFSRRVRKVHDAVAWMERRLPSTVIPEINKVLREFAIKEVSTVSTVSGASKISNKTKRGNAKKKDDDDDDDTTEKMARVSIRRTIFGNLREGTTISIPARRHGTQTETQIKATPEIYQLPSQSAPLAPESLVVALRHVQCNNKTVRPRPVSQQEPTRSVRIRQGLSTRAIRGTAGAMVWHLSTRRDGTCGTRGVFMDPALETIPGRAPVRDPRPPHRKGPCSLRDLRTSAFCTIAHYCTRHARAA